MGLVGVGLANALAGHASRHTRKLLTKGGNPFDTGFWEPIDIDDAVLDAVLGICIFKVGCSAGQWWPSHSLRSLKMWAGPGKELAL